MREKLVTPAFTQESLFFLSSAKLSFKLVMSSPHRRLSSFSLPNLCSIECWIMDIRGILHIFCILLLLANLRAHICIILISTISALISLRETKRNLLQLRDMARMHCDVNLLAPLKPKTANFDPSQVVEFSKVRISSEKIVPGDLVEIEDQMEIPCDMISYSVPFTYCTI